jgi:hypothetical protein
MSNNTTKKYYWRHDESCSCGIINNEEEWYDFIDNGDGLVAETDEKTYAELIANGYDH